jgi:hypothetical protein
LSAHTFTIAITGEDSSSNVVIVIVFFVFVVLFAIFVANANSLCITLLILSIFLNIMQIDSVRL